MAGNGIKPQRIRDPLHNLIEFRLGPKDELEHAIWSVIQTPIFQRLRRIRQLGFSEIVYPGATHTRFSHSIGVYHTARNLIEIIKRLAENSHRNVQDHKAQVALAAALVHDVGHGMFSHAFEEVGDELKIKTSKHELVGDMLIRDSDIKRAFEPLGKSFADEVADVIKGGPQNYYDAVVSSQFDADRLDYMRRDRLMTGVQNSGIDFDWLLANLEIGTVQRGVDDVFLQDMDTLVLGPKAFHAAESYILALFQLYPNIYYHKTTRGAEKIFTALMVRLIKKVQEGSSKATGLPDHHPIIRFAKDPENTSCIFNMDDTVFWGAVPMLIEAEDKLISTLALRLHHRNLLKCIDIHDAIVPNGPSPPSQEGRKEIRLRLQRVTEEIKQRLMEWSHSHSDAVPRILVDQAERSPYKRDSQPEHGPLRQILIRKGDHLQDMSECSDVVAGLEKFSLFRAYIDRDDQEAKKVIAAAIDDGVRNEAHD